MFIAFSNESDLYKSIFDSFEYTRIQKTILFDKNEEN